MSRSGFRKVTTFPPDSTSLLLFLQKLKAQSIPFRDPIHKNGIMILVPYNRVSIARELLREVIAETIQRAQCAERVQ